MPDNLIRKYAQVLSLVNVNLFSKLYHEKLVSPSKKAVMETLYKPLWFKWLIPLGHLEPNKSFVFPRRESIHWSMHGIFRQIIHSESAVNYQKRPIEWSDARQHVVLNANFKSLNIYWQKLNRRPKDCSNHFVYSQKSIGAQTKVELKIPQLTLAKIAWHETVNTRSEHYSPRGESSILARGNLFGWINFFLIQFWQIWQNDIFT